MKLPWRKKSLPERALEARTVCEQEGLSGNPEVLYLLYSELRSANVKFAYMLGVLSIIVALLTAHVFVGYGK